MKILHESLVPRISLLLFVGLFLMTPVQAQDSPENAPQETASDDVEQQDDAFRRRMELEDARNRDRNFADTTYETQAAQEKIDKLPQESRENIREQLIGVIVENGEWEPKDALEDYPYEPSEAASGDPALEKQEQEAWDEQIQKYHEREAAAFGSYRGPVPGPGNPTGQEGGAQDGSGQQGGEQGASGSSGSAGAQGQQSADSTQGTYQPYTPGSTSDSDENSTAGVSESALDFLRNQQAASAGAATQQPQQPQQQARQNQPAERSSQAASDPQTEPQNQPESEPETQADETRGIIAIRDLDKLEGTIIDGLEQPPLKDEDEP